MSKNVDDLKRILGVPVVGDIIHSERILPHSKAVVVTAAGITTMKFSLIPYWSREAKVKYATYNARLETIEDKNAWRGPFLTNHCFVPMDAFIEPIYEGDLAGHMVRFDSDNLMYAAGIFDTWINKTTGEAIESFAIITSEPSPFVKSIGHDRQPLFLDLETAKYWNNLKGSNRDLKDFLFEHSLTPNFKASIDRPLKTFKKKHDENLSLF